MIRIRRRGAARGRRRVAAAVFAAALAVVSASARAGILPGLVVDADTGDPVAGAAVAVMEEESAIPTDALGRFELAGRGEQAFTLIVSHPAYETALRRVEPRNLPEAGLVIRLAPAYFKGEKVVVSASRYGGSPHLSQSNLTAERLAQERKARDLPLLLESVPGVYAATDAGNGVGYTYLKLRGFDQKRIGVAVNGIPLNDPEDHQVYWVDMPDLVSSLEDIQVQRGIANSLSGMTAIGGTVNLVTRLLGDEPGGQMALAAGSYGTRKQTLHYQTGLLGGRFATGLRISHLESEGYRERSGSDQWGVFWSGRVLTERSSLQANVYTGRELSHHAWDGIDDATYRSNRRTNPETYANAIDDFRQPHYELHHRWTLSDRAVLKNSLYWIHGEGFYENFRGGEEAAAFGLDRALGLAADAEVDLVRRKNVEKDQAGLISQLVLNHPGGRLIAGGDLYDFRSRHWGDLQAVAGFSPDAVLHLPPYYDYEGDKIAWSVTLNEQVEIGAGITLLADLHLQRKTYDFMQNETGNFRGADRNAYSVDYTFFNPKGGVFALLPGRPLGGELSLYAHVGLGHREPADDELFDTWSGPDDLGVAPLFATRREVLAGGELQFVSWSDPLVEAERVLDYEAGLSWRGERLSLAMNGYLMNFDDEIVPYGAVDEDGGGIRGNAERTLHRGVECGLTARLAEGHTLRVAASRSWDELDRFVYYDWEGRPSDLSGNPIALFPQYLASASLESRLGPVETGLRLRAAGRQYLDNSGLRERSLSPYEVLDLAIGLDLPAAGLTALGRTRLELTVYNLNDEQYATSGYYDEWGAGNYRIPAAERHILLGVRHDF